MMLMKSMKELCTLGMRECFWGGKNLWKNYVCILKRQKLIRHVTNFSYTIIVLKQHLQNAKVFFAEI